MSRGPGWLQRAVLKIFETEDRELTTFEIAAIAYAVERDKDGKRWVTAPGYRPPARPQTPGVSPCLSTRMELPNEGWARYVLTRGLPVAWVAFEKGELVG